MMSLRHMQKQCQTLTPKSGSAMKSEIESMRDNQVCNLVDQPDGVKTIECKWIYKKKNDMDGNVHIYKARLVAK
jgi:hypothetical protein